MVFRSPSNADTGKWPTFKAFFILLFEKTQSSVSFFKRSGFKCILITLHLFASGF